MILPVKSAVLAICLALASSAVTAQSVTECDWRSEGRYIVQPWGANSHSFAGGKIQVALLRTGEYAYGSDYLMLLWPNPESGDYQDCAIVGFRGDHGFANLGFSELTATRENANKVGFDVPGYFVLPEQGFSNSFMLSVTMDYSTGEISTDMALGRE